MKIRTSFVSNSSTSSFVLYGCQVKREDFPSISEEDWDDDPWDALHKVLKGTDLRVEAISSYDDGREFGIGLHPFHKMKDDETKLQFMNRVELAVEKALGKPRACSFMMDAWRDG